LEIQQITQAQSLVCHQAIWAHIFFTISDSANPTSTGRLGIW